MQYFHHVNENWQKCDKRQAKYYFSFLFYTKQHYLVLDKCMPKKSTSDIKNTIILFTILFPSKVDNNNNNNNYYCGILFIK